MVIHWLREALDGTMKSSGVLELAGLLQPYEIEINLCISAQLLATVRIFIPQKSASATNGTQFVRASCEIFMSITTGCHTYTHIENTHSNTTHIQNS